MSEDGALEELLSEWDRGRAEGRLVTAQELCASHPELLVPLQRRIEEVQRLEQLEQEVQHAVSDSTVITKAAPSAIPVAAIPTLPSVGEMNAPSALATELDLRGYELLETLGQGGMGEVHRSCDPSLGRDLAIKVIKADYRNHPSVEQRFLREARITGSLQHPNIVPVYNLGRLADGRLHYTMRLVRGRTLAQILKEEAGKPERLPALLGIFEKICQAAAYAHSKRVLHRDLKPGNVMIGRFGEVQVMDWGLAKLLSGDDGTAAEGAPKDGGTMIRVESVNTPPEATRLGSALGTPAYMAPEQATGDWEMVDERADVFALGAILCEILTGAPPYRREEGGDLLRRARRGDLAEALARLEQCGADAALTALCRECLNPDRDARPRDAAAVALLVSQYQAEVQERLRRAELERVAAEARAREEQARAAAERRARQRTLALAGALLVLLVGGILGIVAINREQHLTATALEAEKRRRVQAREALDAMSSEVIDDLLAKQNQLTQEQKKYLEKALASYEEFAQDTGQDEETRRGLAGAYLRMATIRHRLGRMAGAEEAYRRSQEQFARLVAEFPDRSEYREGLGMSHSGLGRLLQRTLRRQKEAEAAHRDAIAVHKQAAAYFPTSPKFRDSLSGDQMHLANLLHFNRRYKEAEAEFRAALAIMKQLVAESPDNAEFANSLATIQYNLSHFLMRDRQWTEMETAIRAGLAVREPLVARFPTRADFRRSLAMDYSTLGTALRNLNRLNEARDACRKALPLLKQLANDFPSRPDYQNDVATALIELAQASAATEPEQARRLLEEALPYSQVALQADPGNIDYLAMLYMNYQTQANVFVKLRDHAAAAAVAEATEPILHTANDLYEHVCGYCDCVKLAAEDAKLSEAKRKELCKSYGDRAMNALRRAVEFGYKDVANVKKDKSLDPLRERDDFQKLLAELEKPAR
jgi:tetratricopeptide (TPR) repeat protein